MTAAMFLRQQLGHYRRSLRERLARYGIAIAKTTALVRQADVAIFHEFRPPPDGGGHQFLRALWGEFERRSIRLENNAISHTTRACLYNSYNFDFERLRRLYRDGCRMVHRVDGPLAVYRGTDEDSDYRIWQINQELADATVFQSNYSLQKHLELGLEFKSPCVIMNASDPQIFHRRGRVEFDRRRKIRLISTSWSDNLNKGAPIYKWVEDHLDWERFEYTFVGRSQIQFERIHMIAPVPSEEVADLLRQHDIYIVASKHDPCSNALTEALSCGLPAIYLNSGGHPEIVKGAGLTFEDSEEIPELLDRLVDEYEDTQARISVSTLKKVADQYLHVMGIEDK
jgi:glycosyltransferase involved in cell wall biosynthesis